MTDAEREQRKALWRQKRAERREKQRAANPARAKKMHAARLAAENETPRPRTAKLPKGNYIGCSGWYYRHWGGLVYPENLPTKDWFRFYATQHDTVELNAPFYSWPTAANVKTWLRQAEGSDLVYTVKVNELITHVKRFRRTQELVKDFGHIADMLGARMGCFLFQLPPSYAYTPARLKTILAQLDPQRRNAVEFRHKSWWNEKVYAAFRAAGAIFVSCSGPRLPDELVKTAEDIYIRFHGPERWYRHDYSTAELQVWAERIRKSRAKRVFAYFNNDYGGFAPKNAKMLRKLLS